MPLKIEDAKSAYEGFTEKASEMSRQLAFAAVAFVWVLQESKDIVAIQNDLILPLLLAASALACDFLQYVYGSLVWGTIHRSWERSSRQDGRETFSTPRIYTSPAWALFWSKILFVMTTYFWLVGSLIARWTTE